MLNVDLAKQLRLIESQTGSVLQSNIDMADMVCSVIDKKLRESEATINEQKERIGNIINGMNEGSQVRGKPLANAGLVAQS